MYFCKEMQTLIDERCKEDKIFALDDFTVNYTTKDEDVTVGEKPASTPHREHREKFSLVEDVLVARETKSYCYIDNFYDGIRFNLTSNSENLSQWGIYLPFNCMGKKNSGGWKNQFLINSPYTSEDKQVMYVYLSKPNGCNIMIAVLGGAEGWKIDYSSHLGGHYFMGLSILANFDKAYKLPRREQSLTFVIYPCSNLDEGLKKLAIMQNLPVLNYKKSGGVIGEIIDLICYGVADELIIENNGNSYKIPYSNKLRLERLGETRITPVFNGRKGASVTVYTYDNLISLYKKSMDSVDLDVVENTTDGNLCEHQCWASAMLRFLLKYSNRLTKNEKEIYEKKILSLLNVVTEIDESKAIARRTILAKEFNGFPAYHIFKSRRIQEQFFGVTLLLDAYKYFQDERYYKYAVNTLNCLLDNYQDESGALVTEMCNHKEDYSTVCCVMIPLVDMANFVKNRDEKLYAKYKNAAIRMAEYLYQRGMDFPTEGGSTDLAEREMEDGSISCTALSLLYYCKNLKKEDRYIQKAKEILDVHDNWVINTPICQMKNSSLRWWETQWEGDKDGPAICAGHAWTIWRAEADWLYAVLTNNEEYMQKASNGFMTNFSKIQENGLSYAIYNPDFINGGGFAKDSKDVVFRVSKRFPDREDSGLSRYVWIRINDTFLRGFSND